MIGPVSHDPLQLRDGLQRTPRPVIFDTETTGLDVRCDRVLSYGFRVYVDGTYQNFIIFASRCSHASIQRHIVPADEIRWALSVLDRPGQILIGHNLKYDISMLRREGMDYRGETRDTQVMLRLIDQDRQFSNDTYARQDLCAPPERRWTNYALKDCCSHLLGIHPQYTPSANMNFVNYREHAIYLAHDLYITHRLHDFLWQGMSADLRWHYADVQSPLTLMLADMRWVGTCGDAEFIASETERLEELLCRISRRHERRFGVPLANLTDDDLRILLYEKYRLPYRRRRRQQPSLRRSILRSLLEKTSNPRIRASLRLIIAYRRAESLQGKIATFSTHLDRDGRFHSEIDNNQATGRFSITKPNLQQVAKKNAILGMNIRSRNIVVASPGCDLVAADVAQADVRVLAHEIDRCEESTAEHRRRLHRERFRRLRHIRDLYLESKSARNPNWRGESPSPLPQFDPDAESRLVRNFREATGDFYSLVASEVTGRTIKKNDEERKTWKTILLAQINSESAIGLAQRFGCTKDEAKQLVVKFFSAYPDIKTWIALQQQQVALAGRTYTWAGRMRTNSAHCWMVSERRVRLLLTYRNGPRRWRYWFDVVPVRPTRRFLTAYVHRVWNVADESGTKPAKLIYDHERGRIGTKFYSHLDKPGFYLLPFRNLPWRNIRRVQKLDRRGNPVEMAKYEGLDATCRSLVNSTMQGGTVDVVVQMMLRGREVCNRHGARLLLNIHDELVFEIPRKRLDAFLDEMRVVLTLPPGDEWEVPIVMDFKIGERFGELKKV